MMSLSDVTCFIVKILMHRGDDFFFELFYFESNIQNGGIKRWLILISLIINKNI